MESVPIESHKSSTYTNNAAYTQTTYGHVALSDLANVEVNLMPW